MFLLLTRYHYWLDNINIYIYIYCAIPKVRVPCQLSLTFVQHARRHQDCLYVNHRCSSFQWEIIAHGGPIFEHILQNNHVGRAVPHPGVVSPHCICHPYGLFFEDVAQKSDPLLQYRLCALRIGIHLLEGPLPPVLASQGGELCSQADLLTVTVVRWMRLIQRSKIDDTGSSDLFPELLNSDGLVDHIVRS